MNTRTRRYFTDSFKKEMVYKIETNQLTLDALRTQYNIPKPLARKWLDQYKGISGQLHSVSVATIDPINSKINKLVVALIEQKLEEMVGSANLTSFLSSGQAAQI